MDFKDLAAKVLDYAPMVGGALVGPPGAAVGSAVKVLAGLFGIANPDPKPEEIMAAMSKDPDMALKLKQADYQFTLEMRRIDKEEFLAAIVDVASARNRQIEHEKATGKTDINLYILAWTIIGGFLGLTCMLLYFAYHGKSIEDSSGVLFMLLGTLSTSFGMVVGYFFGTSLSSRRKDAVIANSIPADQFGINLPGGGKK